MRLLQIPIITTVDVATESDIQTHRLVRRAISELEPSHFYMYMRRGDHDRVRDTSQVTHFFDDSPAVENAFYSQMASVNFDRLIDMFSWRSGYYPVDAVFSSRAGVAPLLSLALSVGNLPVPVVCCEPRVYGPGEFGHNESHPIQSAIRAAGYAVCYGFYMSKFEKASALDAASQYVQPGVLYDFEKRAVVVDWPVEVDAELISAVKPTGKKRIIYAGRLNSNKNWTKIIESYSKVLMSRTDVEVWLHGGTGANSKIDPAYSRWHMTSEKLPRDEYIAMLSGAHVGAYLSDDEGMCVTPQEMLMAGIAMVMPDRTWVHKLFDPLPYPFIVKSAKDLPAMIDWLVDHYAEAHARLAPIREMIARDRSWAAFTSKFRRLYDMIKEHPKPEAFNVFEKMASQELARSASGTLPYSTLMNATKNFRSRPSSQYMGSYSCYRAVRHMDSCDSPDPLLRRVDATE